jgi:hypothetical protein
MAETMAPTMRFRWFLPSIKAVSMPPGPKRLQQLFETSTGQRWIDVPMVVEDAQMDTAISPETQAVLDAIDANIRAAQAQMHTTLLD